LQVRQLQTENTELKARMDQIENRVKQQLNTMRREMHQIHAISNSSAIRQLGTGSAGRPGGRPFKGVPPQ
jgi:flagellar capping protein FliD